MGFKIALFVIASAGILYLSRASLRSPRSHGFYRFFAWEAMLVLFLLNVSYWFVDPVAPHQVLAWTLLIVSLVLVIQGFRLLRSIGQPDPNRVDGVPRFGVEKTTRLVTSGLYHYIRHPLYSSLLFLNWGVFFKHPSWIGLALALVATAFLVATAKVEEAQNLSDFGTEYAAYMKTSKMFVPYLF